MVHTVRIGSESVSRLIGYILDTIHPSLAVPEVVNQKTGWGDNKPDSEKWFIA